MSQLASVGGDGGNGAGASLEANGQSVEDLIALVEVKILMDSGVFGNAKAVVGLVKAVNEGGKLVVGGLGLVAEVEKVGNKAVELGNKFAEEERESENGIFNFDGLFGDTIEVLLGLGEVSSAGKGNGKDALGGTDKLGLLSSWCTS